jgi:hypothetical protein
LPKTTYEYKVSHYPFFWAKKIEWSRLFWLSNIGGKYLLSLAQKEIDKRRPLKSNNNLLLYYVLCVFGAGKSN